MEKKENILGTEKIGKLIKIFSIPCIISMLVNSLYNIVDQIFIGWGINYLANGATNVVFPLTMLCLAFALMFGDGTSAFLSLKLGQKKDKEAAKGVMNGVIISSIFAIIVGILLYIFLPQLINLFGCTDALREYALDYGYIIVIGLPLMMIGTTLNSIIRADGSPKFSMFSMSLGAVLNIILDPLFIFVFHMGIEGAAIATVISQFVTFILNVLYLRKMKSIKLAKEDLKLNLKIIFRILALGISSFLTQISIVAVMAVENNLLSKYGALSQYGSEIPITVVGIVMKINQILNSIIIGIAVGAQPILGYNYGAQKYDRVKKALKIVLILSAAISAIAFLLFQLIPDKLILLFGTGNELYMEFACIAFRTYLMLCIFAGIQISSGIFFQAIGKSAKSAFISLFRQILFLIPAMIILSNSFGIMGVLYAGPLADGLAFLITGILLTMEVKKLNKVQKPNEFVESNIVANNTLDKHIVITIAREYGSGGRYIGKLVANKLGIKLYDKEFIRKLAEKTGLSEEYIKNNEQKRDIGNSLNLYYNGLNNDDNLFIEESNLIKELAGKESCVIVGRCADFILKDNTNVVKIFIYSDMENKINRAVSRYHIKQEDAEREIKKINKLRSNHYKYYTGREWNDMSNYDICINSDAYGVENAADMICDIVKNVNESEKILP